MGTEHVRATYQGPPDHPIDEVTVVWYDNGQVEVLFNTPRIAIVAGFLRGPKKKASIKVKKA